jgi:hypothetical protein
MGGKILDKLLINRINYHLYRNDLLSKNQYGFTPQRNTIDAAMAVKAFTQPIIENRGLVFMASLDVQKAFDSAAWPVILQGLRDFQLPKKPVQPQQSIFQQQESSHKHTKLYHREGHNKRIPARVLLRTRILEQTLQLLTHPLT